MATQIEVRPVTNNAMMMEFIKLPWTAKLYQEDPAWVPPVIGDMKAMFDPEKGYFFEYGQAEYFIAYKNGAPVGRITAHTYSLYEEKYDRDTGFFGFYECIDDIAVSKALFDRAAESL
ncbi:MAG: hypothetical protein E4G96_05995, partial [Chrysiogenales bacterium]